MRTVPAGLLAAMQQEVTTLARIVRITNKAGTTIRATDASQDLTDGVNTYVADPGFIVASITHAADGTPSAGEIDVTAENTLISLSDIAKGVWDGATCQVSLVDFTDLSLGEMVIFHGFIGAMDWDTRRSVTLELQGFLARMSNKSLEKFNRNCVVDLFSTRCGVTQATFTHAGEVLSVGGGGQTIVTDLTDAAFDAGYFRLGTITWLTGNNAGLRATVRTWNPTDNRLGFWTRPPGAIQVGDTFEVTAGCDKDRATCDTRFDNILNFQGFPYKVLTGATRGVARTEY
jgi:uncharacterized phage protein (TIGR02218 family)